MNPRIETLSEKKLIGKRIEMSIVDNKTFELWQSFMLRRKEIQNNKGTELYSMQQYNPSYFENFNPKATFEKWAAIEVTDFDAIPPKMEAFTLTSGNYAVFEHKGQDTAIFDSIFNTWLPNSGYLLDNRPHFELLGSKYNRSDSNSEEEIWIPIKTK